MNLVVLTAALSSLNAGLYSTGRILHSMSMAGSAPKFAGRMNKAGVPYGGIALTAVVTLLGVGLNAVVPEEAFEIVLNVASPGHPGQLGHDRAVPAASCCHWAKKGLLQRPSFRMFGAPYTGYLVAGLPGRRAGADRLRLPGRHLDRRLDRRHRSAADPRLVPVPGTDHRDRRGARPASPGSSR